MHWLSRFLRDTTFKASCCGASHPSLRHHAIVTLSYLNAKYNVPHFYSKRAENCIQNLAYEFMSKGDAQNEVVRPQEEVKVAPDFKGLKLKGPKSSNYDSFEIRMPDGSVFSGQSVVFKNREDVQVVKWTTRDA